MGDLDLNDQAAHEIAMKRKKERGSSRRPPKWVIKAIQDAYKLGREHEANLQFS